MESYNITTEVKVVKNLLAQTPNNLYCLSFFHL
nr:MAG TPA: hypothetical protein [Caudoviricetes sp.]